MKALALLALVACGSASPTDIFFEWTVVASNSALDRATVPNAGPTEEIPRCLIQLRGEEHIFAITPPVVRCVTWPVGTRMGVEYFEDAAGAHVVGVIP
jgi:hypothetical protein